MENLNKQVLQGISKIAEEKIAVLNALWKDLFEPDIGEQHLELLLEHVDAFFTDIINETKDRGTAIRERINSLHQEKLELKRLLKEDAEDVNASNVPLHTLQKNIDDSLKCLRKKLEARREEITNLLREQEQICDEIGEIPRQLSSDPLPSEREMQEFREHIEQLKELRYNRYDKILQLREKIKEILVRLEITSLSEYDDDLVYSTDMKPTTDYIEKVELFLGALMSQYSKMESQIIDMSKRLNQLWKYLDIPEKHHRQFAKYTEVTQTTYDKLLAEVQRCELIKKENIRNFIERVRVEIEEYWDKCLKSDAERMRFPSYTAKVFNEDVLELHECEFRDLKSFYEDNEAIFNIIQERQELWNQMESLQSKESDPKRYNNRGGQLLKEEKERKMITMKLPKIEAKLIEMVSKYEQDNNRSFTMYGVPIQDIIEKDYEAKRQEKLTKSGKKVQATPARTPGRVNMTARTPLTVEQTIINHTAVMKTTGGRLRVAAQKAMSTTTSSTASTRSVRTENGKRKLPAPKLAGPQAKRQLLGAFASPANALRQNNENATKKVPSKNVSLKVYNVGSCIKRTTSRKSGGKKRRSSAASFKRPVPEILVSSEDTISERDATSYEGFENYVYQSKSVVRSSEVAHRPNYLPVNHHGFASPVVRKPRTPGASTPKSRAIHPKELEFSMIL